MRPISFGPLPSTQGPPASARYAEEERRRRTRLAVESQDAGAEKARYERWSSHDDTPLMVYVRDSQEPNGPSSGRRGSTMDSVCMKAQTWMGLHRPWASANAICMKDQPLMGLKHCTQPNVVDTPSDPTIVVWLRRPRAALPPRMSRVCKSTFGCRRSPTHGRRVVVRRVVATAGLQARRLRFQWK